MIHLLVGMKVIRVTFVMIYVNESTLTKKQNKKNEPKNFQKGKNPL